MTVPKLRPRRKRGRQYRDLTGQQFGMLTAEALAGIEEGRFSWWDFRCHCGNLVRLRGHNVVHGGRWNCGCMDGCAKWPEYKAWKSVKDKARRNDADIDLRWAEAFMHFWMDMGKAPQGKHHVSLIDRREGFHKNNCRWSSRRQMTWVAPHMRMSDASIQRAKSIVERKLRGESYAEIAESLGLTNQRVSQIGKKVREALHDKR